MSHVTHEWVMSHMNESYHTSMRHVTHQCVISHINASCHTSMSHVSHQWVVSHMNSSCHTWMSHITHEWVMSHINESCHTSMSHVTSHLYDTLLTCWYVTWLTDIWHEPIKFVAPLHYLVSELITHSWSHINESCHISMSHVTHQWVMSHINESCQISVSRAAPPLPGMGWLRLEGSS